MTLNKQGFFRRRFIKVSFIIVIIFACGLACLYIWFIHNSNKLLIDLVNQKSAGKLKLELSSVRFDFFSNEVKIHKATITSTNKNISPITYQVSFRKVVLHTNSMWSLLRKRSLEIRQIKLYDPIIEVFNRQKDSVSGSKNKLSLGMELGKLYNSVEDAISALNTHSIFIINAKLILVNKTDTGRSPVIFSNIYFTLKKLHKHRSFPGGYLNNNNVIFRSSDQDISLSDGIHKLLFKKLVVQQGRSIILDSCTIIALPTQTSGNSYNIQFKRLALIGVDFDTLYKTNLIKADSVYGENPVTNINLNSNLAGTTKVAKGIPDLEKILQQFSGNLDLGFVGVKNADIHVNITGKRGRSNINYGKGNFEIKNLRINPDSSRLISIKNFDMIIKGYNLYNADSSCVYSFDSIRFASDKLLLNNFSVHTASGINKIRNYRDYSMPYFELLGLDWPELVFKQNLKATAAILHDPTISYIKTKAGTLKKSLLFNSHHTFDDFMEIGKLKIINGKINIKWGGFNFLQLQGLNLSLLPNKLKSYKDVKLQKDVESLFFSDGYLKIGDIKARLQNVIFKANDQIHAEEVLVNSSLGGIDSKINDVSIKNIYTETSGNIVIDGLEWEQGNILVNPIPHHATSTKRSSILVKNISGKQTQLKFINSGMECNAFVEDIQIANLEKNDIEPMMVKGFNIKGQDMNLSNAALQMNATNFLLSDSSQELSGVLFKHINEAGTLNITTPYVHVTGNITSFFANDFHLDHVVLKSPLINFIKQNTSSVTGRKILLLPAMKIDHISIQEPVVNAQVIQALQSQNFSLPYSKGSEIKADDVQIASEGVTIGTAGIKAKKAEISKGTEKVLKMDNGIDLNLSKINISLSGDSPSWNAMVNKLSIENSNGFTFNIKENTLELKDLALGDCLLSSASINDIGNLVGSNHSAWISTSAVKYYTRNSLWQCFNVNYNAGRNVLLLDSFNYQPSLSRDSAIAANPYQMDYISLNSGKTRLYGFDMIKYFNEDSLGIQKVSLSRPSIIVYRDKFPPFLSGVVKYLPVEMIRNIQLPVSINQIEVADGKVSYTERNARTRKEGTLLLTHLNGNLSNIKNESVTSPDSLSLAFSGKLMDSAFFDLKVKESYVDSLNGFRMTLKIKPTSVVFLNPLLAPLSNLKFTSGKIDSFYLSAVGREYMGYGGMKLYYHDLRIRLLKNGGMEKTTFVKSFASVLANTFVLKTNNRGRTGLIYFKRLRDRSFFNYIVKMILSGMATSVGVKRNIQYKKYLNDTDMSEIL
jgi:hypothetical protein